ncbi:glycosyltransferase family 4 protein [Mangrovibacillus sp. Mu-81]|uniref:glycosyltransferase family 4 protein n=1 Tax=Mangrovibacillus sp. Mu-81 TaxID=3121478 RepID=UPI002FE4709F
MKVCHISSSHQHNDTRIFLKECTSLAKKYDATLIAPNAPFANIEGVQLVGLDFIPSSRFERLLKVPPLVYKKALEIDADVYHLHDPEMLLFGLLLKRKGKKVIYDIHEDVPRQILSKKWIPNYIRSLVSKAFEVFEDYCAKRFDTLITATSHIKKRFDTVHARVYNVNNYPLLNELHSPSNNKIAKDTFSFVGGINEIRGIQQMVEAIEVSSAGKLTLAGKFSKQSVLENMKCLKGWSKIQYNGFMNRQEVSNLLASSYAGLVLYHPEPNHINAQPNKMFEYMSAGIPVIASNFPLWREIIETNDCGICVDPLKPQEIAAAMDEILINPNVSEEFGRNARKAIETKYNWNIEEQILFQAYENL